MQYWINQIDVQNALLHLKHIWLCKMVNLCSNITEHIWKTSNLHHTNIAGPEVIINSLGPARRFTQEGQQCLLKQWYYLPLLKKTYANSVCQFSISQIIPVTPRHPLLQTVPPKQSTAGGSCYDASVFKIQLFAWLLWFCLPNCVLSLFRVPCALMRSPHCHSSHHKTAITTIADCTSPWYLLIWHYNVWFLYPLYLTTPLILHFGLCSVVISGTCDCNACQQQSHHALINP